MQRRVLAAAAVQAVMLTWPVAADFRSLPTPAAAPARRTQTGIASFYGACFHGRRTASGEIFDMHELSAAHRTLPLGTVARVTNLANGLSVVVRVNDRGPYIRGRVLDLSRRAARMLGFVRQGTTRVLIEILGSTN